MNLKKNAVIMFITLMSTTVFASDLVETQYKSTPNKIYLDLDKAPQLKIANYNIAGGLRNHKVDLNKVAKAINALDPDIIALEEVDQKTTRSDGIDQIKELAKLTKMYFSYGVAIQAHGGNYGNAILSKYPIEKTKVFKLPSGDYEQRSLMLSKINIPGFDSPVYIYNTHFDWHEEDEVRMSQARFINSIVFDDLDLDKDFPNLATGIFILAGDFNSTKNDRVVKELNKYWNLVEVAGKDTRTWPAGNPGLDLDHIFTGKGQKWKIEKLTIPNDGSEEFGIKWQTTSDHIPIMATLKLIEQ
ncbi:endonuclease [Pectobacterium parmentieri]|uniref:Endonuclease n=1 Tax=Pectobacterium parmentieri TaxID=1905730 RepID=A0A8B3F9P6_PECPM|nr:endonuclease/exonuclease/phosphatase family protein [Pectobacterium parmentieri]ACX88153.1 Endonuclease/exonuclease/phosphatase [Pectobacterium parmentieri WPP163]AYH01594.1 endonuclease [Pectobacterium parmentieri]AYH10404.1 endonuclease [Pectobacterium parmentieri]AYH18885.1 endonuclease [Pectobacterium parmentieri]AYH27861.1 endonuclease [Pectobacterium parmentieri]